jgi:hypothetical protein
LNIQVSIEGRYFKNNLLLAPSLQTKILNLKGRLRLLKALKRMQNIPPKKASYRVIRWASNLFAIKEMISIDEIDPGSPVQAEINRVYFPLIQPRIKDVGVRDIPLKQAVKMILLSTQKEFKIFRARMHVLRYLQPQSEWCRVYDQLEINGPDIIHRSLKGATSHIIDLPLNWKDDPDLGGKLSEILLA